MSTADRLSQLTIKDDGFLFDPTTGDTYVANLTALTILRSLQDGRDEATIAGELFERYEVPLGEARRDVVDLLERLKSWQLV